MNIKKFSVKFYPRIDKINKQGLTPIYARIVSNKKVELSTTMLVPIGDWDTKAQRVSNTSIDAKTINPFLDSFNSKILDAYSKLFIEGKALTADGLKERIFSKADKPKSLLAVQVLFYLIG